jgi:hypothetical protein
MEYKQDIITLFNKIIQTNINYNNTSSDNIYNLFDILNNMCSDSNTFTINKINQPSSIVVTPDNTIQYTGILSKSKHFIICAIYQMISIFINEPMYTLDDKYKLNPLLQYQIHELSNLFIKHDINPTNLKSKLNILCNEFNSLRNNNTNLLHCSNINIKTVSIITITYIINILTDDCNKLTHEYICVIFNIYNYILKLPYANEILILLNKYYIQNILLNNLPERNCYYIGIYNELNSSINELILKCNHI